MDAIVQLIRNALCCVKDLGLFPSTFLWDASHTRQYYNLPSPLDETTPLEVVISIVQLYVVFSATSAGFIMFFSSLGKLRRIQRLLDLRLQQQQQQQQRQRSSSSSSLDATVAANRIINASLVKEAQDALRSLFIGFLVHCIGWSFVWLAANSWHVTKTDWIGGLPGLIHALTVNEICLLPLIYFMYQDGVEQLGKAGQMQFIALRLRAGLVTRKSMNVTSYEMLTGWCPFWDNGMGLFNTVSSDTEHQFLHMEATRIEKDLTDLFGTDQGEYDDNLRQYQASKAKELVNKARMMRMEGYREFVYFLLNAIAFYGYLLGILTFYFDNELKQPLYVRRALLQMNNTDADWHGNFAGDLMWTIEPLVILGSPLLLKLMQQPRASMKLKAE